MSASLNLEDCERAAVAIAREAGKMINDTCGKVSSIESKESYADLVTDTDKNVERLVFDKLKKQFPSHKFIGEEGVACDNGGSRELTDEPTWIVDPVDGTMNFVHTFPHVAVCLGLAVNKKPVLGVVYFPSQDKMYTGRQGGGAYCNGTKLSVRRSNSLRDSLVCCEMGGDRSLEKKENVFRNLEAIGWQCHGIRALGSAALDILAVASGHANAFYEFGLHCWDLCAPCAIAQEAGGFVCDTKGEPLDLMARRVIVAASESLAKELSKALVNQIELPRD